MKDKTKEIILYGLSELKQIIDKVIKELNVCEYYFDIRLILTEGLSNAFKHGNKGCVSKPIYLRYCHEGDMLKFEIEDSGMGFQENYILNEFNEEDLLSESGRGLFIIKSLVDKIDINKNTLIIQKRITA